MKASTSDVPVLLLIFNRPNLTQKVFQQIRQARPRQLFIAADGPRYNVPEDKELCAQARQIVDMVDWECQIHTLFRDTNLGCKRAVSSAIDWFFEHIEAGIILEDDCLPHPTFFRFCAELLNRYRDDERIMVISGTNFLLGRRFTPYSYYFSRYNGIWGWATWRRAWQHYDSEMKQWPTLRSTSWLLDIHGDRVIATYWRNIFDRTYAGKIDSWGYQWLFSCWAQNGLAIHPEEVNLVSNIGFGKAATHTKGNESRVANLPVAAMQFPLRHPSFVVRCREADSLTFNIAFRSVSQSSRFKRVLRKLVSKLMG